jgi:hypothetical protein
MSLTFGGVPLLYDWNGVAAEFLAKYQSIEDLLLPPDSSARDDYQNNPVGQNRTIGLAHAKSTARSQQRIGIPRVQFTDRPPLRVNQLCWPATFAARWAFGVFLINTEGKDAIEGLDCTVPYTLECTTPIDPPVPGTDGTDFHVFQAEMLVLEIRRITGTKDSPCEEPNDGRPIVVAAQDLFLLVLVDYRFYLQFRNLNDPVFTEDCTGYCENGWEEFYQYVATRAGLSGAVSTGVLKDAYVTVGVDCKEFSRKQDNAAVVLDAIAASIGCRTVFPFTGGMGLSDGATASATLQVNLASMRNQLAGDRCPVPITNSLPESVEVSFPKSICGQACNDERFVISKPTSAACAVPGTVKTFHDTSYADYTCPTCGGSGGSGGGDCDMSGNPKNYAALDALATQIAADFISLSYYWYEFTWSSPQPWIPCAYDDWIIVKFGTEWQCDLEAGTEIEDNAAGTIAHTTLTKQFWRDHQIRIQSLTQASFTDSLLHGSTVGVLPSSDDPMWAEAQDCIELCAMGNAKLKYRNCNGELVYVDDECVDIVVDNRDCMIYALPGDVFRVERPCGSHCWFPAERFGLQRGATVNECVPCDETGLAHFWQVPNSGCGGSGSNCDIAGTECTAEFLNSSGRVLGCLGPEKIEIAVAPGSCCWFWSSGQQIPTELIATLNGDLCPGESGSGGGSAAIVDVEFIGACAGDFTPPTTATNPLNWAGCDGQKVMAKLKLTDCDCEWIITYVEPKYKDVMKDVKLECTAGGCGLELKKKLLKKVAIWSCDPTVCDDTAVFETASTINGDEVTVQTDTTVDCAGSGGCGGITKTYKDICVLCPGEGATSSAFIPFTSQTFVTSVGGTNGGCGGSGEGNCAATYTYKSVCGLFCEVASGTAVAWTMTPVEVLTSEGQACDCTGLTVGKQKIMAMCVCDPTTEKILSFNQDKTYVGFNHSGGGSGSGSACYSLSADWITILTIDCPGCEPTIGEDVILESQQIQLVGEIACGGGCPSWAYIQVCVLGVGDVSDLSYCDCTDCPDPPSPCPSGSGS